MPQTNRHTSAEASRNNIAECCLLTGSFHTPDSGSETPGGWCERRWLSGFPECTGGTCRDVGGNTICVRSLPARARPAEILALAPINT